MFYTSIQGWTDFEEIYDEAIRACEDGAQFVEVGVWKGRSACYMAERIRESGKQVTFHVVDPFDHHQGLFDEFRDNLSRAGVWDFLHVRRERSLEAAASLSGGLDFVFIDGDHGEAAVSGDLHAWYPRVRPGGVLAGHDYTDHQHSPGVRPAVDLFVAEGRLVMEEPGSSWLLRKPAHDDMQFGVTIPTYRRPDGSSPRKVRRSIESVKAQSYENWRIYLIGDHYDDDAEFQSLASLIPHEKRHVVNLEYAPEREGGLRGLELWRCAGSHASNIALDQQCADGIPVTCRLDDDDAWDPEHLRTLAAAYRDYPAAVLVYTQAESQGGRMPTESQLSLHLDNRPPIPSRLIHSASSWRLEQINLRYSGRTDRPGDADLWARVGKLCAEKGYRTLYVPRTTVIHDSEKSVLRYYSG